MFINIHSRKLPDIKRTRGEDSLLIHNRFMQRKYKIVKVATGWRCLVLSYHTLLGHTKRVTNKRIYPTALACRIQAKVDHGF